MFQKLSLTRSLSEVALGASRRAPTEPLSYCCLCLRGGACKQPGTSNPMSLPEMIQRAESAGSPVAKLPSLVHLLWETKTRTQLQLGLVLTDPSVWESS